MPRDAGIPPQHRVSKNQSLSEIHHWIQTEGFDWLDEEDQQEIVEQKQEKEEEGEEGDMHEHGNNFREQLAGLRRRVGQQKPGRGSVSSQPASEVAKRQRRWPPLPDWMGKELSETAVSGLLPAGFRLFKDYYNRRWELGWQGGAHRRSRSWQLHGVSGSVKLLLQHAWHVWTSEHGEPCPLAGLDPAPLTP